MKKDFLFFILMFLLLFWSVVYIPPRLVDGLISHSQKGEQDIAEEINKREEFCPKGMEFVPTGEDERDFCIDKYEYPNKKGQFPIAGVNWYKARELCKLQKKRLCTEAEWEMACRTPQNNIFPYGAVYDKILCRTSLSTETGVAKSGVYPECVNEYGVYDMSGNVWEWTTTTVGRGQWIGNRKTQNPKSEIENRQLAVGSYQLSPIFIQKNIP